MQEKKAKNIMRQEKEKMPEKEKLLKKKVKYQENAMLGKLRKTVPRRKGITLSRND